MDPPAMATPFLIWSTLISQHFSPRKQFCISMAVEHNPDVEDLMDDDEDALSFCGFPIHEPEPDGDSRHDDQPSCRDLFEFRIDTKQKATSSPGESVFCGEVMLRDEDCASQGRSFLGSSESFMRSKSFRYGSQSRSFPSPPAVRSFGYQQNSPRRPMALIGLARTPSRMELSEIRKRQARLAPVPMFSVVPAREELVPADGTGGGIGPWGLLRPLRYRSVLVRVLAKAASGCITRV